MAVTNKAASVLAKLKNKAKLDGINYQVYLQLFVQEEFLRRLSRSSYIDNFVLKGGMFIYTLTEFESRPTRDMDFLMLDMSSERGNINNIIKKICNIQTENDFLGLNMYIHQGLLMF